MFLKRKTLVPFNAESQASFILGVPAFLFMFADASGFQLLPCVSGYGILYPRIKLVSA